uniref:Uncharacterized protein n=1 Tax=Davidia involucrata TaxID=16924 RepID=A0A5B7C3T2_DAVIN
MVIPDISIISNFEAGMNFLQNPSLLSGSFSLSGIGKVSQLYSFWKWSALILALVTTFSCILINRIKILFLKFHIFKPLASSEPLLQQLDDDSDFSEDDTCSLASSVDEEFESAASSEDRQPVDEDFCVAGSSYYRDEQWQNRDLRLRRRRSGGDRFSWSDFATGKSVVKLWDSFGFGLDLEDSSGSVISIWDLNKDKKISSVLGRICQIPAVSMLSPTMILSAEVNNSNSVVVGAYDTRVGRQIPAIYAEWRLNQCKIVGINSGGVEKVYVRDEVTGALTIGDMRNVKTPLQNLTESDGDTWRFAVNGRESG